LQVPLLPIELSQRCLVFEVDIFIKEVGDLDGYTQINLTDVQVNEWLAETCKGKGLGLVFAIDRKRDEQPKLVHS